MSDEENDPSKIVSLFVMGEYEELNDLVRDGSKKLRDSKSLSDEAIFMYNRPRQNGGGMLQPMAVSCPNSPNSNHTYSPSSPHFSVDPNGMSPTNASTSSSSNQRKRVFSSAEKLRTRYKQAMPRSTPPKLKSNPRDRPSSRSIKGSTSQQGHHQQQQAPSSQYHRGTSNISVQAQQQTGMLNCNPNPAATEPQQQQQKQAPHYFQQQCNFFPGNSDWTEALGFSVNSLWNCGANGGHMSPTMTPPGASSPRGGSVHSGHGSDYGGYSSPHHAPPTTGGGMYHGSGAHGGDGYHHSSGYHHNSGYHHQQQQHGYNSNSGYYAEGRNPSQGYSNGGYRSSAGVRDTVVM